MIPFIIVKKILLFFAPFLLFYFLRKIGRKNLKKKPRSFNLDKSKIVEGEVVEEEK